MNTLARIHAAVVCCALACLSFCGSAAAQFGPTIPIPPNLPTAMPPQMPTAIPAPPAGYPPTVALTAAGSYLAPPAWNQMLAPNLRFVILGNFDGDAVLDRETGVVWSRKTVTTTSFAGGIESACWGLVIGKRVGWRLPSVRELQSLVDLSVTLVPGQTLLPVGHPFLVSPTNSAGGSFEYWANDIRRTGEGQMSDVRRYVRLTSGTGGEAYIFDADTIRPPRGVLCVRGADPETKLPSAR